MTSSHHRSERAVSTRAPEQVLREALADALVAMRLAQALPGVSAEFDFSFAIEKATAALLAARSGKASERAILLEIAEAMESHGYAHMTNGRDIGRLLDELDTFRAGAGA